MSNTHWLKSIAVSLALASTLLVQSAQAQIIELVTNGSLTGPVGNMLVPTGWQNGVSGTTDPSTVDTIDTTHNTGIAGFGFAAAPSTSADGGTWVGLANNFALQKEKLSQVISNFIIGNIYTLSWYDANFGINQTFPNTDSAVIYNSNNSILASLTGTNSNFAFTGTQSILGNGWNKNTFTFTPTETQYTLVFSSATSAKSYLSIDGISITTDVTAVPEPSTWALLLFGLLTITALARKQTSINQKVLTQP